VTLLVPVVAAFVVVVVIACVDLWVLADARRWARVGSPVVFRLGSFSLETPERWAVACLLLFIFFVPIYAAARRA
jgi:hypothetical protein